MLHLFLFKECYPFIVIFNVVEQGTARYHLGYKQQFLQQPFCFPNSMLPNYSLSSDQSTNTGDSLSKKKQIAYNNMLAINLISLVLNKLSYLP